MTDSPASAERVAFGSVRDADSLQDLARGVNSLLKGRSPSEARNVKLDWSAVDLVEPSFVVTQAALISKLEEFRPYDLFVVKPRLDSVHKMIADIGFFSHFFPDDPSAHALPISPDCIRLTQFSKATQEVISEVASYFEQHIHSVSNLYERMEGTLDELMSNVEKHSDSSVGGFLAGQHDTLKKQLRFSVADLGVSVPGHLSRLTKYQSGFTDSHLLLEAFKEGVTGTEGRVPRRHFGSGLPYIKGLTASLGGWLRVYSRFGLAELVEGELQATDVEVPYPGTMISIVWPTR